MGLLSSLFRRGGKAAAMAADEPVTRLPVNFTRELGPNAMPIAPPAPFRNSLRGGSQDLAEAARMGRGLDGGIASGGQSAIAEPMHPAFQGMTREEFLGNPRITTNRNASDLKPKALTTVQDQPPQPFMGGRYQIRMSEDGAAVYDGDNVIASYNFGDTLVVDRAHRRRGIAQELVYQWRTRFPGPAVARERTRASQAIQEQVWERIKNHSGNGGGNNPGGPLFSLGGAAIGGGGLLSYTRRKNGPAPEHGAVY